MHDSRDSKKLWRLHHSVVVNDGRLLLVKAGRRSTPGSPRIIRSG